MFTTKSQLAMALGIDLISAPGLHGMTDGTWVADTGDYRGLAQAMLVRAGREHTPADVQALAEILRTLVTE